MDKIPTLKSYGGNKELDTAVCLIKLFYWEDIHDKILDIMDNLKLDELSWSDRERLIEILDYIASNNLQNEFSFSKKEFIIKLSKKMPSYFQIKNLIELISKHKIYLDLIEDMKTNDFVCNQKFQNNINDSWSLGFDYFITVSNELKNITDKDILKEAVNNKKEEARELSSLIKVDISSSIDSYVFDYEKQLNKNISANLKNDENITVLSDTRSSINETDEINNLFDLNSHEEF